MARKHHWTHAQDETVRTMRGAGQSWDLIARAVGVCRWTTIQHAVRDLGLDRDTARPSMAAVINIPTPERDPLPAGHPISWGAIVAGTCLATMEYPT